MNDNPGLTDMARQMPFSGAIIVVAWCASHSAVSAQSVEITPFGGYRFGRDFFELVTRRPVDSDGAPAVCAIVDIPVGECLQIRF